MTALLRSYARAKAPLAEASKVAGEALEFLSRHNGPGLVPCGR